MYAERPRLTQEKKKEKTKPKANKRSISCRITNTGEFPPGCVDAGTEETVWPMAVPDADRANSPPSKSLPEANTNETRPIVV